MSFRRNDVVSHTTVPEFFHDIIPLEFPNVTEKFEALAEFYFKKMLPKRQHRYYFSCFSISL